MEEPVKHIILIGFKNVGKTVVGKRLAEKLGRPFLDLDAVIEKAEGMPVRALVEKMGETALRERESAQLEKTLRADEPAIVALGGGTPMRAENQEIMSHYTVILLTGPKDEIYKRIMKNGRPAFFPKGLGDRDAFEKLYSEREPIYTELADFTVDNNQDIEEAVDKVIEYLNS